MLFKPVICTYHTIFICGDVRIKQIGRLIKSLGCTFKHTDSSFQLYRLKFIFEQRSLKRGEFDLQR